MTTPNQSFLFDTKPKTAQDGRSYEAPKVRATDPEESREAAKGNSDEVASRKVREVMQDGKARTDEQIYQALQARGYTKHDSRARHGRKHLQEQGKIEKVGRVPRDPETGRGPFALFKWVEIREGKEIPAGSKHAAWLVTRGAKVALKHD